MEKYVIKGGCRLTGEVNISGAKNAAVAIIPATILADSPCRLENLPDISDVKTLTYILESMGAKVEYLDRHTVEIDPRTVDTDTVSADIARRIRASYYFLGALLGRCRKAVVPMPGGCNFGIRPIDQHLKGFAALGCDYSLDNGMISVSAPQDLHGASVYMDVVTVGATMNIMLAAVKARGLTVIENAAREPHIVDLANFLNTLGADIRGAGTDTIKIHGVQKLRGATYSIIPDQIEAGTYMVAAAAAGGEVKINNVIPRHLESISAKLREMGVTVIAGEDCVTVKSSGRLRKVNIKTMPYPGFPTDMQPQFAAALCLANGSSVITEGIYDNRFKYLTELRKMGAQVQVDGRVALIEGVDKLCGAPVAACDLRAGAAMVIAGLCAEGTTEVEDVHYIERGYEDFVGKLRKLGADIALVHEPDEPERMKSVNAG